MTLFKKIALAAAAAVVLTAAGVALATRDAVASGGQTEPYAIRVTLATGSGGGESTAFYGTEYSVHATSVAGRHTYDRFTLRRPLSSDPALVGNFVQNRRFATVQIEVVTAEGTRIVAYRLNDASIAQLEHVMDPHGVVFEQATFTFASIDYDGFAATAFHDANTPH
jgi:hypothetical protein